MSPCCVSSEQQGMVSSHVYHQLGFINTRLGSRPERQPCLDCKTSLLGGRNAHLCLRENKKQQNKSKCISAHVWGLNLSKAIGKRMYGVIVCFTVYLCLDLCVSISHCLLIVFTHDLFFVANLLSALVLVWRYIAECVCWDNLTCLSLSGGMSKHDVRAPNNFIRVRYGQ